MIYEELEKKIIAVLEKTPTCVLATSNRLGEISADQMSLVSDGLTVYIQTDGSFEKVKNISENPNVALNLGAYSFRGTAKLTGNPSNNPIFVEKIKQKHPSTYAHYTNLPNEVLIEISLTQCKIWESHSSGNETITTVDLRSKQAQTLVCDKM